MAADWMKALATCFDEARRDSPEARLMLLCDIDGTIIDMRYLILHVLHAYDAEHGTRYFEKYVEADSELDAKRTVALERCEIIRAVHPQLPDRGPTRV